MLTQLQPILTQATRHKKGRKGKSRPIFVSKKTEVLYLTALNGLIDEMHQATLDELNVIMTPQIGDGVAMADGLFDRFMSAFANFSGQIKDKVASLAEQIAKKIVGEQKKASDKQLSDMLFKQTGIDLTGLMNDEELTEAVNEAIGANVALIKSIPKQYLDRVELAVLTGLQNGELNKTLADELQKIHNITKNRAELIASDQLAKINSRLSQIRQQRLGITHYTWRTSRDERVRHDHRLRDDKLIAWDNPPDDGHAGQAIRCRCVAEPYTEHLLGGKSPEEVMAEQEAVKGGADLNSQIDKILKQQQSAIKSVLANSSNLITDNMGDLTRLDLPHGVDGAKGWTGGIMGLRKSERLMKRLIAEGKEIPPAWAIHHWSIDSSYLVDRYRKNPFLADDKRLEMKDATDKAESLIKQLFSDERAVIKEPIVLFRGVGLPQEQVSLIEKTLNKGGTPEFVEQSYNSNTLKLDLAKQFAIGAVKHGNIPVVHKTLVKSGVKGIDITELNYYDEQEILLQNNLVRKVVSMQQDSNGVIELTSIIEPNHSYIGDSKSNQCFEQEVSVYFPDDPHLNKVAGTVATLRIGTGKISDIRLDD